MTSTVPVALSVSSVKSLLGFGPTATIRKNETFRHGAQGSFPFAIWLATFADRDLSVANQIVDAVWFSPDPEHDSHSPDSSQSPGRHQ
jgi:hypothetical protein